ncbi:ATP-binding cassette domain-containing protein [Maricaulis sp.]|uniref:ATP-binding cassette domain-containing protein n=1 Tax=Maricaulis sp. TaxID=1486257 RepID=UPI003A90DC76
MIEPSTTVLEARQVTKTYPGGVEAVAGVDLTLQRGQLLALAGASGCGKTTMLKLINRLEETSGGSILYEGEDIAGLDGVTLRRSIGWVMQGDGLFPHYTVAENVAIVPRLLGWEAGAIEIRVREMLELVRLDHDAFADRYPDALSGGQRQRVGFARALAGKPDLLLMDEPFGALDPITRDGLQQDFMALQARLGFSALMVTHDMAEALIMADTVAVMRAGLIVQQGSPGELLKSPADDYVADLLETPRRQMRRIAELEA